MMSLLSRLKSLFAQPSPSPAAPAPKPAQPADLRYIRLSLDATEIGAGIVCEELDGRGSKLQALPDDLTVKYRLALARCRELTQLPETLSVPSVNLSGCSKLVHLPRKMHLTFLNLSGCKKVTKLPEDLRMSGGILNLRACSAIEVLPDNIGEVAGLNLYGCSKVKALPEGLKVTSWIDITGTGITEIPEAYRGIGFRRDSDVISVEEALAS